MTPLPGRTGVLGGTFDPVHQATSPPPKRRARALALDQILFIPSHGPRTAGAAAGVGFHRFAMVSLAIATHPGLPASDLELGPPGPRTRPTLSGGFTRGLEPSQLFFILGTDAFAEIATWRDYPAVLDLAHFVVISRPGQPLGLMTVLLPDLAGAEAAGDRGRPRRRLDEPRGAVFLVNAVTPDVSSTEIRERAARGTPLAGLVAPDVERHIGRHRLYVS